MSLSFFVFCKEFSSFFPLVVAGRLVRFSFPLNWVSQFPWVAILDEMVSFCIEGGLECPSPANWPGSRISNHAYV